MDNQLKTRQLAVDKGSVGSVGVGPDSECTRHWGVNCYKGFCSLKEITPLVLHLLEKNNPKMPKYRSSSKCWGFFCTCTCYVAVD